jgi:Cytidylyltransferase-like
MLCAAMAKPGPDTLPERAVSLARWGARIGLLGGSFNPAHEGHRHLSLIALRRLKLDVVWWLVSPQNPLKSDSEMAPLERRLTHARDVAAHPDIVVSAIETELGTRYTVDTIAELKRRFPLAHFVWLMGGGQSRAVPLVAAVADDRVAGADRRHRAAGLYLTCVGEPRRTGPERRAHTRRRASGRPRAAGLDIHSGAP